MTKVYLCIYVSLRFCLVAEKIVENWSFFFLIWLNYTDSSKVFGFQSKGSVRNSKFSLREMWPNN